MLPGTLRFRFLVPAFLLGVVALRSLHAQEIWFSPGDDLNVKGVVKHPDFMQLFGPGAPWPVGMAHVNVMQLRAPWFLRMSPSVVAQALAFLKAHRMKLAVPLGFIDSDTSGQGIEGCGTARGHRVYPREMKQLGIPLDYVVMDEPLYFGHDYDGKNACHFSIAQVADSVANNVRMIRSYYPHVQFVWAEPQQALPGGVAEMNRFLDDYQARLSELPIAMRFDIDWGKVDKKHREWHQDVPLFVRALKTRGIGLSIIYDAGHVNGQPIPKTDAGWIASAKADVADWEATIPDKPAEVVIQTWNPNPVRIVPEDDPTTMTGYLKWFVSRKSSR